MQPPFKSWSKVRRVVAVACVGALIAISVLIVKNRRELSLPVAKAYENLPQAFNQELQRVRYKIRTANDSPQDLRRLASLYQANRFYSEARICFDVLAQTSAGLNAHDHYYLADIAQHDGDLARAQAELRKVIETEPKYLPARVALAETLFKSGDEEAAAAEYAAVIGLEPNQLQASVGLARVELQRGQDDAAVSRLEALMSAHPESTSGAALLAQLLGRRGETERAAAMTQWSQQKREPILADPWMDALLADCYESQRLTLKFEEYLFTGQMQEALAFLGRVEELDPKSWTPQMLRGWSQARSKNYAAAVLEYRNALSKGGDPEKICPLLVTSLLALPDVPAANSLMVEYYAKMPESIPIITAYSEVVGQQGDNKMAEVLWRKILGKEPYLYTPNIGLAKILWARGERDEAVKCLHRIAKVFPVDVASRGLLGQYYLEKSEPESAIEPLAQARSQSGVGAAAEKRLTEMLGLAYLQTGAAQAAAGRFAEAGTYYDKAVLIGPDDLKTHAFIAGNWVQSKQFKRAASALEKMAALQPDNPTIQLSLGDVLFQDGAAAEAREHWQKALQLTASGDADLRHALEARIRGEITAETFQ